MPAPMMIMVWRGLFEIAMASPSPRRRRDRGAGVRRGRRHRVEHAARVPPRQVAGAEQPYQAALVELDRLEPGRGGVRLAEVAGGDAVAPEPQLAGHTDGDRRTVALEHAHPAGGERRT